MTQAGPANGAPTVWTLLALFLALAGPLLVAMFSNQIATSPEALTPRAFSLLLFVLMLLAIVVIATKRECLLLKDLGFRRSSWRSLIWAAPIIAFFVFIFGPVAYAALDVLNLGSFDAGRQMLETLPRWYLALAIIVVAGGEEWLYRGYVIERLERFTGSAWIAGALSLSAFFFAHLPLWGPGPALTTLASGAVLTSALSVAARCLDAHGRARRNRSHWFDVKPSGRKANGGGEDERQQPSQRACRNHHNCNPRSLSAMRVAQP